MKIYRKNRTQHANIFMIGGKMTIGFLIGSDDNWFQIETPKGKLIIIRDGNVSEKNKDLKPLASIEPSEIYYENNGVVCWKKLKYKDGRIEYSMF